MRRPVRTITLPSISSRRIRFGEPTSLRAFSGVIVAAFSPRPRSRTAAAASETTAFWVARRFSSERSNADELELDADHVGRERAQRLLEQLLAGLVALEDDDRGEPPAWRGLFPQPRGRCDTVARKGGWKRAGRRRFRYLDSRGKRITDPAKLERIESLVIPPAWRDVWISPRAHAALQATGLDSAGRRQYLYHPEYRAQQEQAKYDRLIRFAERLPDLARRWPSTWRRIRATASGSARSPFG